MKAIRTPAQLADFLAGLPVHATEVAVRTGAVTLADYPGGPRPSSVVSVSGDGFFGCGENVAFAAAEHVRFGTTVTEWFRTFAVGAAGPDGHWRHPRGGETTVGGAVASFSRTRATPYERAAVEAALIDLGMCQAGLSLFDLTGVGQASLRFVRSFGAGTDPIEPIRRLRAGGYRGDLKVDVDPAWDTATCARLAREPGVVILDFKGRGDVALVGRLTTLFPQAIFEDPPADTLHARISRDASLGDVSAVAAALTRGEAVNLKAPRMAGPLALLRALELALDPPAGSPASTAADAPAVTAYLGGMFEVGVGRAQARQLAALYCGAAPNDLALNVPAVPASLGAATLSAEDRLGSRVDSPPASVRLDQPGFGAVSR